MLHFIMGRAGSGKTYCVRKQFVENPENAVLIVPEQYTFETERALFELGQGKHTFDEGEVLSFSRLCDRVFSLYGGVAEREYDSIIGTLIMGRALQTVANDLTIFKKCANRPEFVKSVISAFSEIKNNGISIEDMYKATEFLDDTPLSMKLGELAKIFTYYETLAGERFSDKNDDLALLYEKLCENRYFEGKTVYFDSFKSFTGMQLKVISLIMAQAKEIYCTLCCDNLDASDPCDLFYTVKKTAKDLIKLANDNNVAVASPVILNTPMRDRPDEIKYLEEVISENNANKYKKESPAVSVCSANGRYEECEFVARTISRLVRDEGYRFREIAVISSDVTAYNNLLESNFERNNIPYFSDCRRPLDCQPIMVTLKRLLEVAEKNYSEESVIALLKTGIIDLPEEDVYLLENYLYLWELDGRAMLSPFTHHPKGARKDFTDSDLKNLEKLNQIRERVILPLSDFCNNVHGGGSAKQLSQFVYEWFCTVGAAENLKKLANEIELDKNINSAEDVRRSYSIFVDILEKISRAVGDEKLSLSQYRALINLVIDSLDMGSLPQGLDEVSIGSAGRSRPANPKIVFVLGANDGHFPAVPKSNGIFSPLDRQKLIKNQLPLNDVGAEALSRENFLFYSAVCCASEKVYITYSAKDSMGVGLIPCAYVKSLLNNFSEDKLTNYEIFANEGECPDGLETKRAAIEYLAQNLQNGIATADAVAKYFEKHPDSNSRALSLVLNPPSLDIPSDKAKRLYGESLSVSPTALDIYHKCGFNYFCKYGLSASPREIIRIDNKKFGTIVHYALENLINKVTPEKIKSTPLDMLIAIACDFVNQYIEEYHGGFEDKSETFLYEVENIRRSVAFVTKYVIEDLKGSKFDVVATELNFASDENGDLKPLEVKLSDGGSISVKGTVDRVDAFTENGETFLRVVDYKTGEKKMRIESIYHGIGLQMFVYLFAVCDSDKFGKDATPSGVLYFPARTQTASDEVTCEGEIRDKMKMSGVVLDNPSVFEASNAQFMPYSFKRDGRPNAYSWAGSDMFFFKVKNKIADILKDMGDTLHSGKISATPVDTPDENACKYCDFKAVCPHGTTGKRYVIPTLSNKTKNEILEGGDYLGTRTNQTTEDCD